MARKDKKKKVPPKEQSTSTGSQEETLDQQPVKSTQVTGTTVVDSPTTDSVDGVVGEDIVASHDVKVVPEANNPQVEQTAVVDDRDNVTTSSTASPPPPPPPTTTTTSKADFVAKTVHPTVGRIAESLATEAAVEATVEAAALIHSSSTPKMDKSDLTPPQADVNVSLAEIDESSNSNQPPGQIYDQHYSSTVMAINGSDVNASDLREQSMMLDSTITDGEKSSFSDSSDVVMVYEDASRSGSDDGNDGEMVQVSMSMIEDPDEPIDRKTDTKNPLDNSQLPETVTVLKGPIEGSYVYVVGTAHFSEQSCKDVEEVIRKVQPNVVVIELCQSRYSILHIDEESLFNENSNLTLESIRNNIKQNGFVQGILYSLLLSLSAQLTRELKIAPGGEFRRALSEAKKIPGCVVQLGDRPVEITLRRAFSSLSPWEKIKLAWTILFSSEKISPEDVERCKQKDLLHAMLNEISGEFPSFGKVLLDERDLYLAYSLQLASKPIPHVKKPGQLYPSTVVGVVGIGHVEGISKNFGKVKDSDISPIMTNPPPSIMSIILVKGFKYTTLCILGYGIYRYLVPNYVKSLAHSSLVASIISVFKSGVGQVTKPKTK